MNSNECIVACIFVSRKDNEIYRKIEEDKMEIEEEFISGFCRTCNGGQTVCCEYTIEGDKRTLTFMDCAHDRCVNYAACEIYKQAHEMER